MKLKSNNIILLCVALSAIIVLSGVVMSVNTTYGRYSAEFVNDVDFIAKTASDAYIIQLNENGDRVELSPEWEVVGGEKCLSFIISNTDCSAESVADSDMTVRVRVFIPESAVEDNNDSAEEISQTSEDSTTSDIGENSPAAAEEASQPSVNLGNLVFTIKIGTRTEIFSSQVDYLSTQTPMYMESENGISGWVYSFYNVINLGNGTILHNEVSCVLNGGDVADIPVTITVQSLDLDTSNIAIYVDRVE